MTTKKLSPGQKNAVNKMRKRWPSHNGVLHRCHFDCDMTTKKTRVERAERKRPGTIYAT